MNDVQWTGSCTNGRPRKVKPNDQVRTAKDIHGFAVNNGLRNSLYKISGGVYRLGMDGVLYYAAPAYNCLTFETLYQLLTTK
jgi:hypothetical protein